MVDFGGTDNCDSSMDLVIAGFTLLKDTLLPSSE